MAELVKGSHSVPYQERNRHESRGLRLKLRLAEPSWKRRRTITTTLLTALEETKTCDGWRDLSGVDLDHENEWETTEGRQRQ